MQLLDLFRSFYPLFVSVKMLDENLAIVFMAGMRLLAYSKQVHKRVIM